MKDLFEIWQWGTMLFEGTLEKCEKLKHRWENKCGNLELEILPQ